MTSVDPRAQAVLSFWLTDTPANTAAVLDAKMATWFRGGEAVDRAIEAQFKTLVDQATAGALDGWAATPRGRLALILLLDQFRRNLYRDTAPMVAEDPKAVALMIDGEHNGHLDALTLMEQVFFLMPHQHAEDRPLQDDGVARYVSLAHRAKAEGEQVAGAFNNFADFARRHRDIIVRFGRFPHRNGFLGRESTAEEQAFLKQPGSSF